MGGHSRHLGAPSRTWTRSTSHFSLRTQSWHHAASPESADCFGGSGLDIDGCTEDADIVGAVEGELVTQLVTVEPLSIVGIEKCGGQ